MHAYGAVAEHCFRDQPNEFSFSFKLHQAAGHMADLARLVGDPADDNDMWVKRMVRCDACLAIRRAPAHL